MDITEILRIFSQVCTAVQHCHGQHLIHRDLKTGNVLLTSDGGIKLADFGFAKSLGRSESLAQSTFGICHYFPPETIAEKGFGKKSDIWQLGICLQEMLMLKPPFQNANMFKLSNMILDEPHVPIVRFNSSTPDQPKFLCRLVDMMLKKNLEDRPTISEVIAILKTNEA